MSLLQDSIADNGTSLWNATFTGRVFLYMVTPKETTFARLEDVPNLITPAFPYFLGLLFLELSIATAKGLDVFSMGDLLTSTGAGLLSRIPDIFGRSIEITMYIWVYNNYCIYSLPIDSIWTWLIAMLGVDFCYYWFHRASHELNILWAFHQTHHSSEYMNLSTALRQAIIQKYGSFLFYQPLALFIPPSITVMHFQLNFLFQFWIHTELIGKLGPLEWFLNTASHHRVHHGRNPYAVDKNYAGFLIIWDRLFGTFEAERDDEKVAYGLIHNVKSFDAVYVQFNHFYDVFKKVRTVLRSKKYTGKTKVVNFVKAFLYGPGWFPSKAHIRLGDPKDLPPIEKEIKRYGVPMPKWLSVYCLAHFLMSLVFFVLVIVAGEKNNDINGSDRLAAAAIIFGTMCSLGYIYDRRWFSSYVEAARCLLLGAMTSRLVETFHVPGSETTTYRVQITFAVSFALNLIGKLFESHGEDTRAQGTTADKSE